MKRMKLRVVVLLIVAGTAASAFAIDAISPEASEAIVLQQVRESYSKITGQPPTETNLLQSLSHEYAHGRPAREVIDALYILVRLDELDKGRASCHVLRCYECNDYWLIRAKCIEALLQVDSRAGLALARKELTNPESTPEMRLDIARSLVNVGVLDGYDVMTSNLLAESGYVRRVAVDLLWHFAKYDDMDTNGQRINVRLLISSAIDDLKKRMATIAAREDNPDHQEIAGLRSTIRDLQLVQQTLTGP